MMNGQIDVESEKGKGTTFTLIIAFNKSDKEDTSSSAYDSNLINSETTDEAFKGKRILIAEDVSINAEILAAILESKGMETDVAENGRIAVDLFTYHEPGYYMAVFMDMRMPEVDGLEAARLIRNSSHPDASSIPIIALTANAFDEDVQKSHDAGMNEHLSKPVEPDLIFKTLKKYL